jgi:CHAT domain-containing protein/tetratricopeptide (TPR) repeat protein
MLSRGYIIYFYLLLNTVILLSGNYPVLSNESQKSAFVEKNFEIQLNENFSAYIINYTETVHTLILKDDKYDIAKSFSTLAECLFQLKQFEQLNRLIEFAKPYTKLHNHNAFTELQIIECKEKLDKGNYKNGISDLQSLLKSTESNYYENEINILLGSAYNHTDELERSLESNKAVLKNNPNHFQAAQAYNGIGSCYLLQYESDTAEVYYQKALQAYSNKLLELYSKENGSKHTKVAHVLFNLALLAERKGDYQTAQELNQKALRIYQYKFGEIHPRTADAYGALGNICMNTDNLEKAIFYFTKDKNIHEKLYGNSHPTLIYSYLSCGTAYNQLGEYDKAETELNTAMYLVNKNYNNNHILFSTVAVELSKTLVEKKKFKEAEKLLLKTIQNEIDKNTVELADAYYTLGICYLSQHINKTAIPYFEKAEKLYHSVFGDKNIYSIDAFTGISDAYLNEKEFYKAYQYADSAFMQTTKSSIVIHPYDHWECLLQIIKCKKELFRNKLFSTKNLKVEIELIKRTLIEANKIRQTYYSAGSQLHYTNKMAELNQLGIYFLTHFYKKTDNYFIDNLLYFAENNKANLLRNKIVNNKADEILPMDEKSKSLAITAKLNYFISLNENQEDVNFNINDSVLFYQNQYEAFIKSIEKKYPKIYSLKYGDNPFTVKQIQNHLHNNEILLEYCNDSEVYYCLAISNTNVIYKICGDKKKVDSLTKSYLISIINKKANDNISNRLYQYLLPVTLREHLLISPDAQLQNLSFDALKYNSSDYLIKQHSIQYAFSAATYFNHQVPVDNKRIIAFYPDFTNTEYAVLNNQKEHSILKSFPDYNVYTSKDAVKSNFISLCNTAGIIHIASHLIVDTVAPLQSALVFQPTANYLLPINDIWKLNIGSQLITLAACQSNFGKLQNGEGIQNFAWAFQYAGAHNILSTQWNASDKSTSTIVSDFYKHLKRGNSKQSALQLAKIDYLDKADAIGAEPFYWANYNLFGDATPIKIAPDFLSKFWWIPVLILLLCYLAIISYQKLYGNKRHDYL